MRIGDNVCGSLLFTNVSYVRRRAFGVLCRRGGDSCVYLRFRKYCSAYIRATITTFQYRIAALCGKIVLYAVSVIVITGSVFCICMNAALLKRDAREYELVIHAGGGGYLNCEEVTLANIEAGYRYIELDFLYTSDGELVCSHRFEFGGYSLENRPTYEEFIHIPLNGGYTGLTLQGLVSLLKAHGDFKVIFDTKESDAVSVLRTVQSACIRENVDFYERFIVQLYSREDYLALKGEGFCEFWFTNYKACYSSEKIEKYFGDDDRVTTIVLSARDWAQKRPFNLPSGKKIAVFTVNDVNYICFLGARGVDFIYTDYGAQIV